MGSERPSAHGRSSMEVRKNLRWVCRLCTINMKERVPQLASVHIFGPTGVVFKLKKYFDIEVRTEDPFPKNICINCSKKLEEIHLFARLATKTDQFWRKYLNLSKPSSLQVSAPDFNAAFTAFAVSMQTKSSISVRPKKMKLRIPSDKFLAPINLDKDNLSYILKTKVPSTSVVNPPISLRNNLEEKRQNLKVVLATSKPAPTPPRINVKSESYLKTPVTNTNNSQAQIGQPARLAEPPPLKVISAQQVTPPSPVLAAPLKASQTFKSNVHPSKKLMPSANSFTDGCLKLGQVVKDIDLLTLILKALKWPYTNDDILIKIDRLKEEPFREVIRNPYLLQDADLMQILNTILSPILLQKQQQLVQKQPLIPAFVSYKIPADLSVHLVTEETNAAQTRKPTILSKQNRVSSNAKGQSRQANVRIQKTQPKIPPRSSSPIEILSDDDSIQMFEVDVDPTLFFTSESQEKHGSVDFAKKEMGDKDDVIMFKLHTKSKKRGAEKKSKQAFENMVETPSEKCVVRVSNDEAEKFKSKTDIDGDKPNKKSEKGNVFIAESIEEDPSIYEQAAICHSPKIEPELIISDELPEESSGIVTPVKTEVEQDSSPFKVEPAETERPKIMAQLSHPTEDVSGDEEAWAQFQVIESSDTSGEALDKTVNVERAKDEISCDKDDSFEEKVIETKDSMDEVIGDCAKQKVFGRQQEVSVHAEASNNLSGESVDPDPEMLIDNIKMDKVPSSETTVEPSEEKVPAKRDSAERTEETVKTTHKVENNSKESVNKRKEKIIIREEIIIKEAAKLDESSSNENVFTEELPFSRKRSRRKNNVSPNPNTKEETATKTETDESEMGEEPPIAKKPGIRKNNTTSLRNSNKRATRSLTAANASLNLRNSNTRRRICKQCGQSFNLLTDFLDHRKMHIESS